MELKKQLAQILACELQKKGKEIDPVRVFAEKMRDHKELESRWAVLQEARVEYFKGKDFVSLLRAHPELLKPLAIESTTEDMEMEIGNLLLRRKLIVRCDRVLKTVRPGKTKLSKWPARIEFFPVCQIFPSEPRLTKS
jgi:translocation protein SEC62